MQHRHGLQVGAVGDIIIHSCVGWTKKWNCIWT